MGDTSEFYGTIEKQVEEDIIAHENGKLAHNENHKKFLP